MKNKRQPIISLSQKTLRSIVTRIVEAQGARKQKLSWYGYVKGTKEGIEVVIMAYEGNPQKKGADIHVPATGVVDFKMVIPTTRVGNATTTPGDEMIKKTYNNLKTKAQQWQNEHKNEYRFRNTIPEYEDIRKPNTSTIKGEDFPTHKKQSPGIQLQTSQKESIDRQFRDARKVLGEQRDLRIRGNQRNLRIRGEQYIMEQDKKWYEFDSERTEKNKGDKKVEVKESDFRDAHQNMWDKLVKSYNDTTATISNMDNKVLARNVEIYAPKPHPSPDEAMNNLALLKSPGCFYSFYVNYDEGGIKVPGPDGKEVIIRSLLYKCGKQEGWASWGKNDFIGVPAIYKQNMTSFTKMIKEQKYKFKIPSLSTSLEDKMCSGPAHGFNFKSINFGTYCRVTKVVGDDDFSQVDIDTETSV